LWPWFPIKDCFNDLLSILSLILIHYRGFSKAVAWKYKESFPQWPIWLSPYFHFLLPNSAAYLNISRCGFLSGIIHLPFFLPEVLFPHGPQTICQSIRNTILIEKSLPNTYTHNNSLCTMFLYSHFLFSSFLCSYPIW
jgi:hypothetical protein